MGNPIGNIFVYMALRALAVIVIAVLLSMFFGVSVFVLIRRWFRRRGSRGKE